MDEKVKPLKLAIAETVEVAERTEEGDLRVPVLRIKARNIAAFIAWLREAYPEAF